MSWSWIVRRLRTLHHNGPVPETQNRGPRHQILEAGVRQFTEWGNTEPGRHILIAVARYLAAHSPTERALLQTADIAARLSRGDRLHENA